MLSLVLLLSLSPLAYAAAEPQPTPAGLADCPAAQHNALCPEAAASENAAPDPSACTCGAAEGAPHAEGCPKYTAPAPETPDPSACTCGAAEGVLHAEGCPKYTAPAPETPDPSACTCGAADGAAHAAGCPLFVLPADDAVAAVQAMIDALPDAASVISENADAVAAQLEAIDEAKLPLTDEQLDMLNVDKYLAVAAALGAVYDTMALEGEVAQIGDTKYMTLGDAIAAVPTDGTQTTIKLLRDAEGGGVQVTAGKNIVFDLGGFTYTVGQPTVGSAGTETNGFHLLKGAVVTIQNGGFKASNYPDLKLMIQNYCDLTLNNVALDASSAPQCQYVISNNNGNVLITGNTSITAAPGQMAFDVYYWPDSYPDGVTVTVDTTGTISGTIEYGADAAADKDKIPSMAILNIKQGTVNGSISTYALNATNDNGISITGGSFSTDVSAYIPDGYSADKAGGSSLFVVGIAKTQKAEHVAEVNGQYFKTLSAAIEHAAPGDTVKLLKDLDWNQETGTNDSVVVDISDLILDLNQKTISNSNMSLIFQGTNAKIQNGSFDSKGGNYALFIGDMGTTENFIVDGVTCKGGINIFNTTDVILRNVDVTAEDYYAVWCDQNGKAIIESGAFTASDNSVAVLGINSVAAKLEIRGGDFNENGKPLVLENPNDPAAFGDPIISGGTYTQPVDEQYCAPDYSPSTTLVNGKYIVCNHPEAQMQSIPALAATCIAPGNLAYYHCLVCGRNFKEITAQTEITDLASIVIPADPANHAYSAEWSYDENRHWHECTVCHDKTDLEFHSFQWVSDANGVKHNVCVCGYSNIVTLTLHFDANHGRRAPADQIAETDTGSATIVIPSQKPTRFGYVFQGWSTSAAGPLQYRPGSSITITRDTTLYAVWALPTDSPLTGDTGNIFLWAAVAAVSLAGLVAIAVIIRKKGRREPLN